MSVRSAQSITTLFSTSSFSTGALANADSLPTGTLYVNGVANAATVTVTNVSTGKYTAQVTLPTLAVGDLVALWIAATVGGVAGGGKVWEDACDINLDSAGCVSQTAAATPLVQTGTAQAGGNQTITLSSGASSTNNVYGGCVVKIFAGTGAGQTRVAQNYNGTTKVLNVDNAWTVQPDATSQYSILAYHGVATDGGQNAIVGSGTITTVTGNVNGSVGSVASGGITAASVAAGALNGKGDWLLASSYTAPDNASIATILSRVTGAVALHSDAVSLAAQIGSPMQAGSAVTIGAGGIASTSFAAGAITDAAIAFPAQAPGRPTTFLAAVRRLWEWRCNLRTRNRSTGAVTVFGTDGTTALETQTQSTTGSVDSQTQGA